jgi:uncharacterized protein YecE (DUF72 family)
MISPKLGCCGFGGSMSSYFTMFDIVEVQHTFYDPPKVQTLSRWRAEAPKKFRFALKAWQLITHEATSPTYRRLKTPLTERQKTQCGSFSKNATVLDAWSRTLECAEILHAKQILFQCPGSFKPTAENIRNMRRFFDAIERGDHELYWEPRGKDWTGEQVKAICDDLGLFHALDPFVSQTVTPSKTYYRLHGKTGWRYVYTDDELRQLVDMMPNKGSAVVFFNNIRMREDALRFREQFSVE